MSHDMVWCNVIDLKCCIKSEYPKRTYAMYAPMYVIIVRTW